MAIYENHTHNGKKFYTYHCFGCQAHGNVPRDEINNWLGTIAVGGRTVLGLPPGKPINRKSRPSYTEWYANTYPLMETPGFFSVPFWTSCWQFFEERNIPPAVVFANKVRASESQDALMFPQYYSQLVSAQARFLDSDKKPKIVHLDMDTPEKTTIPVLQDARCCQITPTGGIGGHSLCFIAESFCDGMAIAGRFQHNPVFTALSTSISLKQIGALHWMLTRVAARGIIIAFDDDNPGKKGALELGEQLVKLGHNRIIYIQPEQREDGMNKPYHKNYLDLVEEVLHADK